MSVSCFLVCMVSSNCVLKFDNYILESGGLLEICVCLSQERGGCYRSRTTFVSFGNPSFRLGFSHLAESSRSRCPFSLLIFVVSSRAAATVFSAQVSVTCSCHAPPGFVSLPGVNQRIKKYC